MNPRSSRATQAQFSQEANKNASKGRNAQKAATSMRTRLHGRFLLGALAMLGGVILFNALALQNERHPSPLFQPVSVAKPAPLPIPTPSRREQAALTQLAAQAPMPLAAPAPISAPSSNNMVQQTAPMPDKLALAERIIQTEKPKIPPAPAAEADVALITALQRELSKRGHYKGEIDGKSGPVMVQAIRSFQFSQRVAIDGKPSEALLKEVRATKIPPMKEELLDLLRKTTPDNRATSERANPASTSTQRMPNKTG